MIHQPSESSSFICFLLFIFSLTIKILVVEAQQSSSNSSVTIPVTSQEHRCLEWSFDLEHPTIGVKGAELKHIGCFSEYVVKMNPYFNASQYDNFWTQPKPTTTEKQKCAARCQLKYETKKVVQIYLSYGICYCLDPYDTRSKGVLDAPDCCDTQLHSRPFSCSPGVKYGIVDELKVLCPLNISMCENLAFCKQEKGCCIPRGSDYQEVPSHVRVMQWVASFLMIAVLFQAIWWTIRMRRRDQERDRQLQAGAGGQDADGNLLAVPMITGRRPQRAKEDAANLAADAIKYFSVIRASTISEEEGCCGVCLEALNTSDCIKTPCMHHVHVKCLTEYVTHTLRSFSADVTCPLCRATLITQDGREPPPIPLSPAQQQQLRAALLRRRRAQSMRQQRGSDDTLVSPRAGEDEFAVEMSTIRPPRDEAVVNEFFSSGRRRGSSEENQHSSNENERGGNEASNTVGSTTPRRSRSLTTTSGGNYASSTENALFQSSPVSSPHNHYQQHHSNPQQRRSGDVEELFEDIFHPGSPIPSQSGNTAVTAQSASSSSSLFGRSSTGHDNTTGANTLAVSPPSTPPRRTTTATASSTTASPSAVQRPSSTQRVHDVDVFNVL